MPYAAAGRSGLVLSLLSLLLILLGGGCGAPKKPAGLWEALPLPGESNFTLALDIICHDGYVYVCGEQRPKAADGSFSNVGNPVLLRLKDGSWDKAGNAGAVDAAGRFLLIEGKLHLLSQALYGFDGKAWAEVAGAPKGRVSDTFVDGSDVYALTHRQTSDAHAWIHEVELLRAGEWSFLGKKPLVVSESANAGSLCVLQGDCYALASGPNAYSALYLSPASDKKRRWKQLYAVNPGLGLPKTKPDLVSPSDLAIHDGKLLTPLLMGNGECSLQILGETRGTAFGPPLPKNFSPKQIKFFKGTPYLLGSQSQFDKTATPSFTQQVEVRVLKGDKWELMGEAPLEAPTHLSCAFDLDDTYVYVAMMEPVDSLSNLVVYRTKLAK